MKISKMEYVFLLSISILLYPGCNTTVEKINVKDYGVIAGGEDATPGVISALEDCKGLDNAELIFPKGEYHFYPDYGVDRYCFISNNDEGLKRIVFPLIDFENLIIDGNGSLFIFHGFVNPFVVENSANITFRNFSIDYNRPFHSEAIILANNDDGIDMEIPENFPFRISNGLLLFTDGGLEDARKTTVNKPTVYPYGSLLEFDVEKRETAFMARDYYLDGYPLPAKSMGERKVRIFLDGLEGTIGNIMTFGSSNRNYPGFTLTDSRDINFHQITIYHSGGMGIIGQRTHNILVDSCKVTPSPGRVISCTADATHFVNCTGKIELSHCLFENQKDDATNIHGIYVQIAKILSPNEIIVQLKHSQQFGFDFLKEDTKIEFVKGQSLITEGEAHVISSKRLNKELTRVSLSQPLPSEIEVGDAIAEIRDYPEIYIHNNIIRKNRARGMLLNSRGKTIVEDNYFHSPGAAILFEGDASFWYEQGGVTDCVIRNNIFDNCLYGVWGKAVIDVGAGIYDDKELSRYNKNIKIYDNTFRVFDDVLFLNLYGVDGLSWYNNKVERTNNYPSTRKRDNFFHVEYSDNIRIEPYTQNE
jgi:hypothetical protein